MPERTAWVLRVGRAGRSDAEGRTSDFSGGGTASYCEQPAGSPPATSARHTLRVTGVHRRRAGTTEAATAAPAGGRTGAGPRGQRVPGSADRVPARRRSVGGGALARSCLRRVPATVVAHHPGVVHERPRQRRDEGHMQGTTVRRIAWAAALLLAGLSVGLPVAAQEASPSAAPAAVQTTQPVEQQDTNDFPWGLLGLLAWLGWQGRAGAMSHAPCRPPERARRRRRSAKGVGRLRVQAACPEQTRVTACRHPPRSTPSTSVQPGCCTMGRGTATVACLVALSSLETNGTYRRERANQLGGRARERRTRMQQVSDGTPVHDQHGLVGRGAGG